MARDGDNDALGANQSRKPAAPHHDLGDQPQQHLPQQQQQSQHPGHHRTKSQKHIVGGAAGGRLHARVPSSKALAKYHAALSTGKLMRKQGSLSPDQSAGTTALASHHHRRATSELKLTHDPSSTNLKKNTSQTNLKRNRSQVEVGKRTKSSSALATLNRSASNPAVNKLRSSGGSSKVQFNLGDEDQDDNEDEWVDASTSASPLLSRRGSAVSSAHTANPAIEDDESAAGSPTPHAELQRTLGGGTRGGTQNGTIPSDAQNGAGSPHRNKSSHSLYLTSRILSRTPSHGAPPMMSTENVSARPASIRQPSPPSSSPSQPYLPNTPGITAQIRPGSSGTAELTSRFVGHNSQEPGSGIPGGSFILAANRGGFSRAAAATNGHTTPNRRQSLGALSQSRGIDALNARRAATTATTTATNTDDDASSSDERRPPRNPRRTPSRRSADYTPLPPQEMNRTQQKLNLQRASSTLEPAHPHPGLAMGMPGAAAAPPLISAGGVPTTYDTRDPRVAKTLERTGTEYLTVRRHLNPVARSIARVMMLPGMEGSRRIPQPQAGGNLGGQRRRSAGGMVDLIAGTGHGHGHGIAGRDRRPGTPRSTHGGGANGVNGSGSGFATASSSLGTAAGEEDGGLHIQHQQHHQHQHHQQHDRVRMGNGNGNGVQQQGLSGASLVDGVEDAGTMALLRMMWDKSLELGGGSQE